MAYKKQTWTAPEGRGLNRYAKGAETTSHIELNLDPANLTNTPTPITVARLNHIEDGIEEADKPHTIPTDAVLQYSFDEIKQLPDNPAGTVYKRDNDWTTVDGWTSDGTVSVNNNNIITTSDGTTSYIAREGSYGSGNFISLTYIPPNTTTIGLYGIINGTRNTLIKQIPVIKNKSTKIVAYVADTMTGFHIHNPSLVVGDVMRITQVYIGDGSYLDQVIDNSYSEAHATNVGVIPVDGVCGKAGYFNNSYMIAPRPALCDDITVYFWAKFDALGTAQTIVQSRTIANTGLSVYQYLNGYRLLWRGSTIDFTGYTPPVNIWHHVCIKMNATTAVLKINGELKVTQTGTYGVTENLASTIWSGMLGTGGTPSGNVLTGALDGLKIVPRYTTDDEDTGEYKARANLPKFYATADKWKTARTITISDADGTNTGTAVSVDGSENKTLKLPSTIKASLSGNAGTADKWKTARNITISDADGTNTGTAVSVDGSENETLKLPSTIKANITGSATMANVRVSLRHGTTLFEKTWAGLTSYGGVDVWTDGDNIYYSSGTQQYVLDKSTSTWTSKTWTGLTNFSGVDVWTDGDNIYYSNSTTQYVLNKTTSTWATKTWTGLTSFTGNNIWTDGDNIYYSNYTTQYVLNKPTSTWTAKTWTVLTIFYGEDVWTDGDNIYYSSTTQYVLNKSTSTWSAKTWIGLTSFDGNRIWTDGDNIYCSDGTTQYVLNKSTSTWSAKTWTGLTNFYGNSIWTDGDNIYYSDGTPQYVLPATRHNYVDENKYQGLFRVYTRCNPRPLSKDFVFSNE